MFSGGLNAEWKNGPWTVTADVSASRAQSHTVGSDVSADPYNGLDSGFPLIADQSVDFALRGLKVGLVLSGGNVDREVYARELSGG